MRTKQLNVWIPEDLRDYIARRADNEKYPMNAIIADLIRDDIVKRNEQLLIATGYNKALSSGKEETSITIVFFFRLPTMNQ
jgi:hypothetical protein